MPAPGAQPLRPALPSPAMGRGFGSGNAFLHGWPLGDFLFPALGDAADRQSPLPTICGHAPSINFENRMLVPLVSLLIKRSLVSAGNWTRKRHEIGRASCRERVGQYV